MYDINETIEMIIEQAYEDAYNDIYNEGVIGKVIGKKQNDKRDPGEVIAFNHKKGILGNIFAPSIGSALNSNDITEDESRLKDYYQSYKEWANEKGVKPTNYKEFCKITREYHRLRAKEKLGAAAGNFIMPGAGSIYNLYRSNSRGDRVLRNIGKK